MPIGEEVYLITAARRDNFPPNPEGKRGKSIKGKPKD